MWVAGLVALAASLSVTVAALAAPAPPPNDNYLASTTIPEAQSTGFQALEYQDAEDTTAATTQTDLFSFDKNGNPLGGAGPEPVRCNGVTYGKTIWYDLDAKVPADFELEAVGFPTVIALYQWSPSTSLIVRRVGCHISNSQLNDYVVPVELQRGRYYTVQIGGLKTPSGFDSGQLNFTMKFFPDHDGDGVLDQSDACPTLRGVQRYGGCPPSIHPIPHFGITSGRLSYLQLDELPGGAQVIARCVPCGLRQVRQGGRHASSVTMTAFAGQPLAAGDKIEIWVTKRATATGSYRYGAFGSYISYTFNSGTLGDRVLRCLMPGSLTPRQTCPPGGRRAVSSHLNRGLTTRGAGAEAAVRSTSP